MLVKLATFMILMTTGAVFSFWRFQVKVRLELYDVQDMVDGRINMGHTLSDFPDDRPPHEYMDDDQLRLQVRNSVRPQQWDRKDGWSVQVQNGLLIVRAPAYVHPEIEACLLDLRRHPHRGGSFSDFAPCGRRDCPSFLPELGLGYVRSPHRNSTP